MHDEVSETENIRNNLAIERIIVGGCDILLDVNQVFIRKGSVLQVLGNAAQSRSRFGSFRGDKGEAVRQCYLFSNHMLLCTRNSAGKLTLVDVSCAFILFRCLCVVKFILFVFVFYCDCTHTHTQGTGKIPLNEATLIEDPNEQFQFTVDGGDAGKYFGGGGGGDTWEGLGEGIDFDGYIDERDDLVVVW